jgi:FkbH-like protein
LTRLAVAATFTAEPLAEVLEFWIDELALSASVSFAPYNQVFQQLLDPSSLLSQNRLGVNILLIRLEDWLKSVPASSGQSAAEVCVSRNATELIDAVRAAADRSAAHQLVAICPASLAVQKNAEMASFLVRMAGQLEAGLTEIAGVYVVQPEEFKYHQVGDYDDPRRDQLGHIPYTPLYFAALGTVLARRVRALVSPPHKVVVLDCDNTLWKGAVGEEGVDGISITPSFAGLQRFMVELTQKGFLLCLCSKNAEADVLEVFDRRPDIMLKREHLVSWRINWQPKSRNIRSIAKELNLGLDSFIFVDDNPVECAEVRGDCPEVLTLQLPDQGDAVAFLEQVWAFDRLRVTSEDQKRTSLYRQEADRTRFQHESANLQDFLDGLDLLVAISQPAPEETPRIAQLTQRTNQFNFTTLRRSDLEIERLADSGLECRAVEVNDRFGAYGLVGALIFAERGEDLEIDTFLVSCRVLGRGVEHFMLNVLGEIAQRRGLNRVNATLIPTRKNQPARDFLDQVAMSFVHEEGGTRRYEIPAGVAAAVSYRPSAELFQEPPVSTDSPVADAHASEVVPPHGINDVLRFQRIASERRRPEDILEAICSRGERRSGYHRERAFVAPSNEVETALSTSWAQLLRLDRVGVHDDFFELGGTSLLAVDVVAEIDRRFDKTLPLTALISAPTVAELALQIVGERTTESLVLIRPGGSKPPLFLVHDGDGETMLYRGLAQLLDAGHPVYGLQPQTLPGVPMAQSRISEMAAYHLGKVRSVQSRGPYYLGGMCAGGVIAFEMARQLQSQGEHAALVALFDAADVAAPRRAWRVSGQRLQRLGSVLRGQTANGRRLPRLTSAQILLKKVWNFGTYAVSGRLKRAAEGVRMRMFRAYLDRGAALPRLLKGISARTVYLFAESDYHPENPLDAEIVLFRATEGAGADEPYVKIYDDRLLGWGRRTNCGVRAFDVKGGHASMLQEPAVRDLATKLQSAIDEATANETAISRPLSFPGRARFPHIEPRSAVSHLNARP